ncbi:hypothetical protein VaNZ11_007742 [Volvox africanus]|uniref:Protein kinase domain-containing protein n=1 Tax=Volvox africanus TaxID=51714 RepID=A0ABQ5S3V2_9CHLO|nr:hypothetical protein VaNZ11_007742 [Volvox africanus]
MRTWVSCFPSCCHAPRRDEKQESVSPVVITPLPKEVTTALPTEVVHCKDDIAVQVSQNVYDLSKLGDVMRACSGIPGSSYHQLGRTCNILADHFGVSYASASVLSSTGITYLPIVAGGRLARLCPVGLPHFLDASNASSLYQVAAQQRFLRRQVPGDELPNDWEALREAAGLAAFMAAAITVGSETVAVLTLADEDPCKFDSPMWQTSMELLGAYLGHLFRDRQLVGYCGVVEELMVVDSLDDLIRILSRCVVRLQSEKLQQMRLTCRIACIASDASSAIIFDEALPYTSVLASAVDECACPADRIGGMAPPNVLPTAAAAPAFHRFSQSTAASALHEGSGSGVGPVDGPHQAQQQPQQMQQATPQVPSGANGSGLLAPRGRLSRMSAVSPCSSHDPYVASLIVQYQVQMHLMANLVPDPVESGPGPPTAPSLLQAQHQLHQQRYGFSSTQLPLQPLPQLQPPTRLQSTAGALGCGTAGGAMSGAGPAGAAAPAGYRCGGGSSSLSQPGLYGGGSLMGEPGREMGLWCSLDPGVASNFSQHQLQVEGQTYLVENTLLAEAIANRAGVWIGDCVAFMQNPANPNADVFLAATAHHTTAMLLAVMWERSEGGPGGGAAAAIGGAGGSISTVMGRLCNRQHLHQHQQQHQQQLQQQQQHQQQHQGPHGLPSLRTQGQIASSVNGLGPELLSGGLPSGGLALQNPTQATVLAAFGSVFPRPSPQHTNSLPSAIGHVDSDISPPPLRALGPPQAPFAPSPLAHSSMQHAINLGDIMSNPAVGIQLPPGPVRTLATEAEAGGGGARGSAGGTRSGDLPLLAFYLLTSGTAPPSVLQEVLVGLRELLVVLEPLVSTKLSDDLSEEWQQLQREVLDKTKILKQPKDRTIVLRNTAAQLGGVFNSHCSADDGPSSIVVSDSFRGPPSPRVQPHPPVPRYTTSGGVLPATQLPSFITGGISGPGSTAAATGLAGVAAGSGAGSTGPEAFRSISEKTLKVAPGLAGSPCTTGPLAAGVPRTRTPSFIMSRSFTGKRISALISGVQDRVQQAQRMSVSYNTLASRPDDLRAITILEKIGSGGFGTVYLGVYQSTEVAVKVIFERDCEGTEVLRNAVELAVLSTLSHPNIVQVLTFFTDVTVQVPPWQARLSGAAPPVILLPHEPSGVQLDLTPVPSTAADVGPEGLSGEGGCSPGGQSVYDDSSSYTGCGGGGGCGAVGLIAAAAGAQRQGGQKQPLPCPPPKKALVILMEFCDRGCLADAIRDGHFREKVKGGYGAHQPAWSHIYLTLLEVALALRYLHSINLVHRDLKPQNVLLKSSPSDVRGFTAKLSDFGLVKLLTEADMVAAAATPTAASGRRPRRYSGTISHVAPEAIHQHGNANAVDVAVDIYAFGIVMWEILTGQPVYLGLNSDQIIERVQTQGLRPVFPSDAPADFSALANRCWDSEPRRRPTAEELVQHMSNLSAATRSSKVVAARRRLSTLSNKELLRNVANANLVAANMAAAAVHGGGGAGGIGALHGVPRQTLPRQHNEDDFPLHIL